ncbi:hypothetical protein ACSNOH_04105 [Streptomyces sp. URMC 127]|uniref:hypothetical protein n=1 Tax=Streptomyces sp. URMC 127 TaxID=3423402 RepID=UPI003F1B66CA
MPLHRARAAERTSTSTEVAEMARQQPRNARREPYERARDEGEPGAHSGQESRARERTVPGTASAREGYPSRGGTAHDEALEGVRAREEEAGKKGKAKQQDRATERTRGDAHGKRTQS